MRRRFFSNRFDYMILYTSTDGNIVHPSTIVGFNQNIKSNIYNHIGKITFKGPFSIGSRVFYNCETLKTIIIPNSITSIGSGAFSYCDNLTSMTIPNSVASIEDSAFRGCSSLTSIEIPNSVTSIGEGAFSNCESLKSIVVDADNSIYDSRNGCNAIIETVSNTLIASCQNTIIPNNVISIGNSAFEYSNLTSIEIPDSVINIGYAAFEYSNLTSIEIPDSVISIGGYAFSNCESLTSIEIPNSVTSIGNLAFYWCESLTSVYIKATTPPTMGISVFDRNASNRKIYVPRASLNAYKTASGWSEYASAIEPYDY